MTCFGGALSGLPAPISGEKDCYGLPAGHSGHQFSSLRDLLFFTFALFRLPIL